MPKDKLRSTRSTAPTSKARPSGSMSLSRRPTSPQVAVAATAVATVAAVTAAATAAAETGDINFPQGNILPLLHAIEAGISFCPVCQGYGELPGGCSVSERGRRTPGHRKKGGNCGRTGRAAKPGHTGITPEFHPNHGEAESGTRTGLGINREGTFFRTSN